MNRPFLILSCLVVALSTGAYFWLNPDEVASPLKGAETAENALSQVSSETTSQPGEPTNLTNEMQHLQIMELELDRAKAAVGRGRRRLAQLEKSGRAGPESLEAKTTRDKLEADRNLVQRLKAEIKAQESTVAMLKAATSRQQ